MADVATLQIEVDTRQIKEGVDKLLELSKASNVAEESAKTLSAAQDVLGFAAKTAASAFAAFKLADLIKESAMLASRFETMGIVMGIAGNNAGYTRKEMEEYSKALQKSGISMLQSRDALTQLATAQIDLSMATKLGRAAQDVAVVGNVNSSEAMQRLIYGIKSGQTEVLKTLGLNVSFEQSYKKLAAEMGKTVDQLTEKDKVLARTNSTLEEASRYNGIYEESMTTAGKAMTSLTRYWEDLKVKMGEAFLPALSEAVFDLTDALKEANKAADEMGGSGGLKDIGEGLATTFKYVYQTVAVVGATVADLFSGIGREMGGMAAQGAALVNGALNLDKTTFDQIANIRASMKADNAIAEAALNAFNKRILEGASAVEVVSAKKKTMSEEERMAAGKLARIESERQERWAAGEKSRKEAQKEIEADYEKSLANMRKEADEFEKKALASEHENEILGKTKEEIDALATAKDELAKSERVEVLATLKSSDATKEETSAIERQITMIDRKIAADKKRVTLKPEAEDAKKWADMTKRAYEGMAHGIASSISQSILQGKNLEDSLKSVALNIADAFLTSFIEMQISRMLVGKTAQAAYAATMTLEAQSSVAQAGLNAFTSTAAIPIVGLGLAPAAAVSAMAAAETFAVPMIAAANGTIASAEGGYDIPAGINPITQLHEKEMVLPKAQAEVIRNLAGGDSATNGVTIIDQTTINIDSRADRASVMKDVQSMIENGHARLVDRLTRQGRLA
jgi:hypothetical protein